MGEPGTFDLLKMTPSTLARLLLKDQNAHRQPAIRPVGLALL